MTTNIYQFDESASIQSQAREWLIRLDRDQAPSKRELAELRQWAATSPAHQAELTRISAFWDDANVLTELWTPAYQPKTFWAKLSIGNLLKALRQWRADSPILSFSAAAATASAVIALVSIMVLMPPSITSSNGLYVSTIGQLDQQTLADGSVVQLNTDSQIQVDYSGDTRKIRLLRGEAHFDVSHNPDWPFQVYAGQGMVKAVGTAFAVRLDPESIKVTVSEGRVDLASAIAKPAKTLGTDIATAQMPGLSELPEMQKITSLDLGQSAEFNRGTLAAEDAAQHASKQIKSINTLAKKELERQLAWRTGYLIFEGDSLSDVVAEINRYTTIVIEIGDPTLANLRVGGRFKVGQLDAMLDVFATSFGVQVSRINDHRIELTSRQSKAH